MLKVKSLREDTKNYKLKYGTPKSSGFDVRVFDCEIWNGESLENVELEKTITNGTESKGWWIPPTSTVIFKTGYSVACNEDEEVQVRARSGYSLKTPMRISNGIGTVDEDFRGEIGVIMDNISDDYWFVPYAERIAQLVVCPIHRHEIVEVEELDDTIRGEGAYGSTGTR